jgi:hypothetical protein
MQSPDCNQGFSGGTDGPGLDPIEPASQDLALTDEYTVATLTSQAEAFVPSVRGQRGSDGSASATTLHPNIPGHSGGGSSTFTREKADCG